MVFEPVKKPQSRSQLVFDQIQAQIRAGELSRGAKLPSEAQLSADFGVSRSAIREALRLLEATGMITSRHGMGSFVSNDTEDVVSKVLSLSVLADETSVHELFEFRASLEAHAARLAAKRRSETDVGAIRRRLEDNDSAAAVGNAAEFNRTDWAFHAAICEAAGNPYLGVVLNAVREMLHDAVDLFVEDTGSVDRAVDEHRHIAEAVVERAGDDAELAARRHVQSTAAYCIPLAAAKPPS